MQFTPMYCMNADGTTSIDVYRLVTNPIINPVALRDEDLFASSSTVAQVTGTNLRVSANGVGLSLTDKPTENVGKFKYVCDFDPAKHSAEALCAKRCYILQSLKLPKGTLLPPEVKLLQNKKAHFLLELQPDKDIGIKVAGPQQISCACLDALPWEPLGNSLIFKAGADPKELFPDDEDDDMVDVLEELRRHGVDIDFLEEFAKTEELRDQALKLIAANMNKALDSWTPCSKRECFLVGQGYSQFDAATPNTETQGTEKSGETMLLWSGETMVLWKDVVSKVTHDKICALDFVPGGTRIAVRAGSTLMHLTLDDVKALQFEYLLTANPDLKSGLLEAGAKAAGIESCTQRCTVLSAPLFVGKRHPTVTAIAIRVYLDEVHGMRSLGTALFHLLHGLRVSRGDQGSLFCWGLDDTRGFTLQPDAPRGLHALARDPEFEGWSVKSSVVSCPKGTSFIFITATIDSNVYRAAATAFLKQQGVKFDRPLVADCTAEKS